MNQEKKEYEKLLKDIMYIIAQEPFEEEILWDYFSEYETFKERAKEITKGILVDDIKFTKLEKKELEEKKRKDCLKLNISLDDCNKVIELEKAIYNLFKVPRESKETYIRELKKIPYKLDRWRISYKE